MTVREDYDEIRHVMGYSKEENEEKIEETSELLEFITCWSAILTI